MGMYDYFKCDVSCPVCGNYMDGLFQTKDLACLLNTYEPGDRVSKRYGRINVYHTCNHYYKDIREESGAVMATAIGIWVEIDIPIMDHIIVMDQNWWTRKWSRVEYSIMSFLRDGETFEQLLKRLEYRRKKIKHDIFTTTLDELQQDIDGI